MLDGPLMQERIGFLDGKHRPLYVDNMRQYERQRQCAIVPEATSERLA
jgi:hypothetical protein